MDGDPDPAKIPTCCCCREQRFHLIVRHAQAFMSALRRAIDFSDGTSERFIAYRSGDRLHQPVHTSVA